MEDGMLVLDNSIFENMEAHEQESFSPFWQNFDLKKLKEMIDEVRLLECKNFLVATFKGFTGPNPILPAKKRQIFGGDQAALAEFFAQNCEKCEGGCPLQSNDCIHMCPFFLDKKGRRKRRDIWNEYCAKSQQYVLSISSEDE